MEESVNPSMAPYACEHEVRIRVTARAKSPEEAQAMTRELADRIYETDAGQYVFAETDNPFDAKNAVVTAMIAELRKNDMSFATAESCTAGMIGSTVGDIPGASDVFVGGIISYANEVKENVLGVPHETLERVGAVSEECAGYMAQGAKRVTGAGIAVSVTGIAGPGGGTPEKPVGLVYIGICTDKIHATCRLQLAGDRDVVRERTSLYALDLVRRSLIEKLETRVDDERVLNTDYIW
jgi:nicotinamide-nucleotide amidase